MWWSHGEEDQRIVQMISLTGRLAGQPKDNNNKKDKYKDKDNHNNKLLKFYYSQVSWLASPFCEALQYNAPVPLFQPKRNSHRKSFPRKKYVSDRIFDFFFLIFQGLWKAGSLPPYSCQHQKILYRRFLRNRAKLFSKN